MMFGVSSKRKSFRSHHTTGPAARGFFQAGARAIELLGTVRSTSPSLWPWLDPSSEAEPVHVLLEMEALLAAVLASSRVRAEKMARWTFLAARDHVRTVMMATTASINLQRHSQAHELSGNLSLQTAMTCQQPPKIHQAGHYGRFLRMLV